MALAILVELNIRLTALVVETARLERRGVNDKYQASFVDDTTLNWENFLPALMLSYNTWYYSTIAMMPLELLFGEKLRLPSFRNPDIQHLQYGESTFAKCYQLLQKYVSLLKTFQVIKARK